MVGYYHNLATKQLYNRLLIRITSLADFDKNKKYDVILIGRIKENTMIVDTKVSWFSDSVYTFKAIGAFNYFSKINGYNLNALSDQKLRDYGKNYFMSNHIKSFPSSGSIYINGGKMFIYLEE